MENGRIQENADVSLHDSRTNHVQWEDSHITFSFPNGFYFWRGATGSDDYRAEMRCHLIDRYPDNFTVYIYRKNLFKHIIREDRTDEFVSAINSGKYEFEFVYTYRSYHGILFKGYIWRKRKPWWRECEIELYTDEITYTRLDDEKTAE